MGGDLGHCSLQGQPTGLDECVLETTERVFVGNRRDDDPWVVGSESFEQPQEIRKPSQNRELAFTIMRRCCPSPNSVHRITSHRVAHAGGIADRDLEKWF